MIASQIPISTAGQAEPSNLIRRRLASKIQLELQDTEKKLWETMLGQSSELKPEELSHKAQVAQLLEQSAALLNSYTRRVKAPTAEVYEESRMIIAAMGIPVIESDGPYEAEGVAARLVTSGIANIVASEDTVSPYFHRSIEVR